MITPEIIEEFKDRMHIGGDEDKNIKTILEASLADLNEVCKGYTLVDKRFKELVFERSRYVYNDALEYFHTNFLTQINNLNLKKALESSDDDAAV